MRYGWARRFCKLLSESVFHDVHLGVELGGLDGPAAILAPLAGGQFPDEVGLELGLWGEFGFVGSQDAVEFVALLVAEEQCIGR